MKRVLYQLIRPCDSVSDSPSKWKKSSLRAIENEIRALNKQIKGRTFEEIWQRLGYTSRSSAWKAVDRDKNERLVELVRLVQHLEQANASRQLAGIERPVTALKAGRGSRAR